jgi:hypothetical protein
MMSNQSILFFKPSRAFTAATPIRKIAWPMTVADQKAPRNLIDNRPSTPNTRCATATSDRTRSPAE